MSELEREHRFVISPDNKAGLVVIVTAIGVCWTILVLTIRVVSKLHIKRSIGLEEILVITASALALVTSCCILVAVKYGFGRKGTTTDPVNEKLVFKLLWTADICYVITLGIAKGATLPLLTQLTPIGHFVKASWVVGIFVCIWSIISVFLVSLRCHSESPWNDTTSSQCRSLFSRWAFIESVSISIEIFIFGLFVAIIHILRMRLKAKVKVVLAFATRLSIIIPTIFRLIYLKDGLQKPNPNLALVDTVITAQAVLHYTTMAASFAYLKPFLRAFDSNLGATVKVETTVSGRYPALDSRSHDHSSGKNSKSRHNQSLGTNNSNGYRDESDQRDPSINTGLSSRSLSSQHVPRSNDSLRYQPNLKRMSHRKQASSESATPIITKTQEWHVRTEPRGAGHHDV